MARLVRREAAGPQEVPPQDKSVWVCMCGLSQNQPFCDGAHKKSNDEEAGKLYVYNRSCDAPDEVRDDS